MSSKLALISVSNKTGLSQLGKFLFDNSYRVVSTGGTYNRLKDEFPNSIKNQQLMKVSDLTKFPEILGGRVKTLHPRIYGGLLAQRYKTDHLTDIEKHNLDQFDLVVVNLYPFHEAVNNNMSLGSAQELIDIGGVSLLRASAKNFQDVMILSNPDQYQDFMSYHQQLMEDKYSPPSLNKRQKYAAEAYVQTCQYDMSICKYLINDLSSRDPDLSNKVNMSPSTSNNSDNSLVETRQYQRQIHMKYGCNPHQSHANIHSLLPDNQMPFQILNGVPGYINVLDAINSWQLVREANQLLGQPCSASFKHTSPAGVAIADKMSEAYLKARDSDPMSSFGDFVALSEECDLATAKLIKREVSDGVIAPSYTDEALQILNKKKGGKYLVLKVNKNYQNQQELEYREMFGVAVSQPPNTKVVGYDVFQVKDQIKTQLKEFTSQAQKDLLLANVTLKYAQSNNVAMAIDGRVVAIASGQQSRVDCVKLCCCKFAVWFARQHPKTRKLYDLFRDDIKITRAQKVNASIRYVEGDFTEVEYVEWLKQFKEAPEALTLAEKETWLKQSKQVCLASDAFFPFRDSLDHASKVGVNYVIQPGGSVADDEVIRACDQYGMAMLSTGVRVFTH